MADKTNAMRLLDKAGIPYQPLSYQTDGEPKDGVTVAELLGEDVSVVYKTLVTQNTRRQFFVFVIPASSVLDLKAAAKAAGEKSLSMIAPSELQKTTGYIRGGVSPVGMKKQYPVYFDDSCLSLGQMVVSAGKIGHMLKLAPCGLIEAASGKTARLV
ncbi:MAG: Cys-tRNA(Pro) deacylase [Christensenellaceae bacterium]|jgi:Cys-tRNA(Pro)/Cys-tRNA(Cys) deacylase